MTTLVLPLPRELRALLGGERDQPRDGDNVGLWLDKFLRVREQGWTLAKDDRVQELKRRVCREAHGASRPHVSAAAAQAGQRMREGAAVLYGSAHRVVRARVQGRLLVDYGRASAHETAVSMHHGFGCPKIPGTALKGVTRDWIANVEDNSTLDVEALFGVGPGSRDAANPSQGLRGRLVFHDALPTDGTFSLAVDVLTPHYGKYYRGSAPPAEWLSPVPHTFITVVDTTMEWVVALLPAKGGDWQEAGPSPSELQTLGDVTAALGEALQAVGIGAKRAAGYGRLKVVEA